MTEPTVWSTIPSQAILGFFGFFAFASVFSAYIRYFENYKSITAVRKKTQNKNPCSQLERGFFGVNLTHFGCCCQIGQERI